MVAMTRAGISILGGFIPRIRNNLAASTDAYTIPRRIHAITVENSAFGYLVFDVSVGFISTTGGSRAHDKQFVFIHNIETAVVERLLKILFGHIIHFFRENGRTTKLLQ
jgi:hypothetical protein